ncbi:MAG TPA: CsgG/HfaB family protein, partial [Phycisphaerae bacterium]|nr:CsgG/HfaB family protein [Phycisphaerae bacterium]
LMLGGLSSKDFRGVCFKMTQSLITLPQIQNAQRPPKIAFAKVTNKSDEIIDTQGFLEKMRTELIKNSNGKVVFIDRENIGQIMDERDMKDAGQFTGETTKKMLGADYLLAGTITGITSARGRKSTNYMRLAFRLTDANTGVIIWEDDYEMKYYHKAGLYDR